MRSHLAWDSQPFTQYIITAALLLAGLSLLLAGMWNVDSSQRQLPLPLKLMLILFAISQASYADAAGTEVTAKNYFRPTGELNEQSLQACAQAVDIAAYAQKTLDAHLYNYQTRGVQATNEAFICVCQPWQERTDGHAHVRYIVRHACYDKEFTFGITHGEMQALQGFEFAGLLFNHDINPIEASHLMVFSFKAPCNGCQDGIDEIRANGYEVDFFYGAVLGAGGQYYGWHGANTPLGWIRFGGHGLAHNAINPHIRAHFPFARLSSGHNRDESYYATVDTAHNNHIDYYTDDNHQDGWEIDTGLHDMLEFRETHSSSSHSDAARLFSTRDRLSLRGKNSADATLAPSDKVVMLDDSEAIKATPTLAVA